MLIALAQSLRQTVRVHALSFVAAITAGWVVMFAWFALNMSMTGSHTAAYRFVHWALGTNGHWSWMTIYFFAAGTRVLLFAFAGWLTVRIHRAHPYAVALTLIASAYMVRWVPWRTYKAFDFDTMAVIHTVTAMTGLLLGATLALWQKRRRGLADTASMSG